MWNRSGQLFELQLLMATSFSKNIPSTARLLHILDGGTGELLFRNGLPDDRLTWSAKAILEEKYHKMVVDAHLEYLRAGSNVITTHNFAVIPSCMKQVNQQNAIGSLTSTAVRLAMKARDQFLTETHNQNQVLIAGSIPPLNESYRADLVFSADECHHWYRIIIKALNEENVDLFLCETMSGFTECKYALDILNELEINKE